MFEPCQEKIISQIPAFRGIVVLPMGLQQEKATDLDSERNKQIDLGG